MSENPMPRTRNKLYVYRTSLKIIDETFKEMTS